MTNNDDRTPKHAAEEVEPTPKSPLLSNQAYDKLMFTVKYVLPGAATLYAALAVIWGFPYGTEVVGTIGAVTIFLSGILGISTASYNKSDSKYDGALVVDTTNPAKDVYSLEVTTPLDEISDKDHLKLKIVPPTN